MSKETPQSNPRLQGGRGVRTQRSRRTRVLPRRRSTTTQGWTTTLATKTHAKTYITRITDKIKKTHGMDTQELHVTGRPKTTLWSLMKRHFWDQNNTRNNRMIIGSLNWLVTLGRYDIYHAASTMAWYGMAPREGTSQCNKAHLGLSTGLSKDLYPLRRETT